jgi:hypothetical protein
VRAWAPWADQVRRRPLPSGEPSRSTLGLDLGPLVHVVTLALTAMGPLPPPFTALAPPPPPPPLSLTSSSSAELAADLAAVVAGVEMKELAVPFRLLKAGTLDVKGASDSVRTRLAKAHLDRHHQRRRCLATDSRGRLLVVEKKDLVVLNPAAFLAPPLSLSLSLSLPAAAAAEESDRAPLGLIGKANIGFDALDLALEPSNERLVALWGKTESCVVVLDETGQPTAQVRLQTTAHATSRRWVV